MKRWLFCCAILLVTGGSLKAQVQPSQKGTPKDSITIKLLTDSVAKQAVQVNDLTRKVDSLLKIKPPVSPCCTSGTLKPLPAVLVFIPLGLLLLVTIMFIVWIRSSNFSLEDALSIAPSARQLAEVAKVRAEAQQAAVANNVPLPVIPDPEPQRSVSRLLAFITGVIAIVIAICLVSYHAYAVFAGCSGDQFSSLWKILAGLGIGVIPYGINVWNGNAKEKEPPTTKP